MSVPCSHVPLDDDPIARHIVSAVRSAVSPPRHRSLRGQSGRKLENYDLYYTGPDMTALLNETADLQTGCPWQVRNPSHCVETEWLSR
jgi:hypothetical protein